MVTIFIFQYSQTLSWGTINFHENTFTFSRLPFKFFYEEPQQFLFIVIFAPLPCPPDYLIPLKLGSFSIYTVEARITTWTVKLTLFPPGSSCSYVGSFLCVHGVCSVPLKTWGGGPLWPLELFFCLCSTFLYIMPENTSPTDFSGVLDLSVFLREITRAFLNSLHM